MARTKRTPAISDVRPKSNAPKHITVAQIIQAVHETKGMIYLAAERLGCSGENITQRAKKTPAIAEAIARETERSVDITELQLIKQINEGNTTAMIFYLKTKGKQRGYIERHELDIRLSPDQIAVLKQHGITPGQAMEEYIQSLATGKDANAMTLKVVYEDKKIDNS